MDNGTTLLLGLDGLVVEHVEVQADQVVLVRVATSPQVVAVCPGCQAPSVSLKQWATTRPRDLDHGGRRIRLVWRKRRWRCHNPGCGRASFTESVPAVAARSRLTTRLREHAGGVVADGGRTVVQAARDLGLSWPTVHAAIAVHAAKVLPDEPRPVTVLGIDETRRGRRRFARDEPTGQLVLVADCWHTGFCDVSGGQGLLDQVEGRDHTTVAAWLLARPKAWRDQVRYVAIDMSASYAAAVRLALPAATIVVDHFHVVQLANHAVTELRRRLAWKHRDRRGRKGDPEWDARRALLRNREDLTAAQHAKLIDTLTSLGEQGVTLLGAWIIKEQLRDLLRLARTHPEPATVKARLHEFYDWCAASGQPELHRLATTIEHWWPAIAAFLTTGITNAVSEGLNRVIKLEARKAYGFRNPANQRLRIRCATSRRTRGHLKPA